ncbi:hypothetical protein MKW98_029352 [Papaver atlanticum]|uniref:MULE transposase domain-containing protein n=1 Tax=Papaver atlanticum TaxID=357466 RepID=A0AAD4XFL9_9MAGN|nr:hypothetical protein MKW98_029352 [Papaver atlanticum]
MALVPAEDNDNWEWFLRNLSNFLDHDQRPITFLSDRVEGLKRAIPVIFPGAFHSFCYYHLKLNLPINASDERYGAVIDTFQAAAYALSPEGFQTAIAMIRGLGCGWVADYIEDIPPERWSNAFFQGCRYGRTSSTLTESFNSWMKVHKKLPANSLLDQIRKDVMRMMSERRNTGKSFITILTPKNEAKMKALIDEGLTWLVI